MIADSVATQDWPGRRWLATIALVMAGQVILIFWLARHNPVAASHAADSPAVFLATDALRRHPDLSDPVLFVLPNPRGFSGNAWMKIPPLEYKPLEWTEPPRPQELSEQKLGSALGEFVRTNLAGVFELTSKPEPQLDLVAPTYDLAPAQSTLTIEGELAHRPLLSTVKLDSWAASELLPNSMVQVGVDAEGAVFSAVLLGEPKDSKEAKAADAAALNFARSARFQSLSLNDPNRSATGPTALMWGRLLFLWHTVVPPATNAPAAP